MQNFILISLIIALGFFLYLIQSGEVNSNDFSIKKLQAPVQFEIVKSQTSGLEKSVTIKLVAKGVEYEVYTFTGSDFKRVPKGEYFMKIYNIPIEAVDAVTGTWLGSRYVFYATEEPIENSRYNFQYDIYKTEYPKDTQETVTYTKFKTFKMITAGSNALEVRY